MRAADLRVLLCQEPGEVEHAAGIARGGRERPARREPVRDPPLHPVLHPWRGMPRPGDGLASAGGCIEVMDVPTVSFHERHGPADVTGQRHQEPDMRLDRARGRLEGRRDWRVPLPSIPHRKSIRDERLQPGRQHGGSDLLVFDLPVTGLPVLRSGLNQQAKLKLHLAGESGEVIAGMVRRNGPQVKRCISEEGLKGQIRPPAVPRPVAQ